MREAASRTMTKAAPRFRLLKKQPAPGLVRGRGKGRSPQELGKWKHRGGLHALKSKFRVTGKQAMQRLWKGEDRFIWGSGRAGVYRRGKEDEEGSSFCTCKQKAPPSVWVHLWFREGCHWKAIHLGHRGILPLVKDS